MLQTNKRKIKLRMWNFESMLYRDIYDKNWYYHPTECYLARSIRQNDHIFPLMLNINFDDRTGKQIYEGDIIETVQRGREVVEIDSEYDMIGYHLCWEKGIIVGNIHQNPELLLGI